MKPPTKPDAARSALMGRVRQRGTKPEIEVAATLRALGARYRLNVRSLPGSPDFANKSKKWAVFVHGCFWHQHRGCHRATTPTNNREFWIEKFAANRRRDARSIRALRAIGYTVVIVWECRAGRSAERLSKIFEARRPDVR